MKTPLRLLAVVTVSLASAHQASAGKYTKEEQSLLNAGKFMEMYKPDEHSRHFIANIEAATDPKTGEKRKISKNAQKVLCFVFGMEDAKPARDEGRSMAECKYSPQQAHEFLFAEGWNKYHDRFFTRCYVQEGEAAYDQEVKAHQTPVDPSSTS